MHRPVTVMFGRRDQTAPAIARLLNLHGAPRAAVHFGVITKTSCMTARERQ
jgi:hypothetical protein